MGFLDQLKSFFSAPTNAGEPMVTWLYVKCAKCGSPLAVRVDLRNEPSIDYETGGYVLNKEMMDSKCFLLMRAQILFDTRRNVTGKTIENGVFITKEEYEETTNAK